MSNKSLVKALAFVLVVVTVLSLCLCVGCNKAEVTNQNISKHGSDDSDYSEPSEPTPDYSIGVITDPQVTPDESIDNPFENKSYISENINRDNYDISYLSEAIFRSAIDKYATSDANAVFIIGDLSDLRDVRSYEIIREGCQKLNDAGIAVYVTPGINDTDKTTGLVPYNFYDLSKKSTAEYWTPTSFFTEFTEYMTAEPITIHEESFSYVADLPGGNFRLISFNSANSFDGKYVAHSISADMPASNTVEDEQIEWLETQLIAAQNAGKQVVMTSYFPFNDDINYQCGALYKDVFLTVDRTEEIKPLLTKYGVKVVYNGHVQLEGESSYTDENGTVQFVSTTSLATYPLPLKISRHVGDKFVSEVDHLETINSQYLPSYLSDEQVYSVTTDAVAFAKDYAKYIFTRRWKNCTHIGEKYTSKALEIMTKLKLYDGSTKAQGLVKDIEDWLTGVNNLPLYGEGYTVESICLTYGIQIPKIQGLTTVLSFMEEMAASTFCGDMDMKPQSDNAVMFKYIILSGVKMGADMQFFTKLHDLNDSIADCELEPVVEEMFDTGKINLATNDFVVSMLTLFVPLVQSKFPAFKLSATSSDGLIAILGVTIPIMLLAFGDAYDQAKGTLWMIPYRDIFDLNNGTINIGELMESLSASIVCKDTQIKK